MVNDLRRGNYICKSEDFHLGSRLGPPPDLPQRRREQRQHMYGKEITKDFHS